MKGLLTTYRNYLPITTHTARRLPVGVARVPARALAR